VRAFDLIAILLTLSAVFSYVNHRYIRLPTIIGLMLIALLLSLALIGLRALGFGAGWPVLGWLRQIDFDDALLHGMLSFLLFAGALRIDLNHLREQRWIITLLATASVIGSTFGVGLLTYWAFNALGLALPLGYCLLFGALISPTDPSRCSPS
jgi:CPA1 family monovalent cation:H+ antiporter